MILALELLNELNTMDNFWLKSFFKILITLSNNKTARILFLFSELPYMFKSAFYVYANFIIG